MLHPETIARNKPGHVNNHASSTDILSTESKTFAAPVIVPKQPETEQGNAELTARLNDLEKAVLLLVESNQRLSAENKSMAAIISRQNTKLDTIAARLPAPPEVAPIQKIHKTVAKVPLFKRIWLELFNPESLRATP